MIHLLSPLGPETKYKTCTNIKYEDELLHEKRGICYDKNVYVYTVGAIII